jgi:hypothetical protein
LTNKKLLKNGGKEKGMEKESNEANKEIKLKLFRKCV